MLFVGVVKSWVFGARNNRVTVRDFGLVMWLGSVLAAACRLLSADSSVAPMR